MLAEPVHHTPCTPVQAPATIPGIASDTEGHDTVTHQTANAAHSKHVSSTHHITAEQIGQA